MSEDQNVNEQQMSPEEQAANAEKMRAEARKFEAEARKFDNEGALFQAEANEAQARAEKEKAWGDQARAEADKEIATNQKYLLHNKLELDKVRFDDRYFRKYQYTFGVNQSSVKECMDMLNVWHREDEELGEMRPFEIVFYSPGGEIMAGMRLFDHIRWLRSQGHHVTTTSLGYAASMGGILLQAGDVRKMGREAYVLIHEASFMALGSMGEVEDEVTFVKMIQKRIVSIFCDNAKKTGRPGHLTPAMMKRKWTRKNWWLDSDECYKLGIVDEVI